MGWKEKDWKKNQNQKSGDSRRDIEIEMLKIQGLLVCPKCDLTYSLYQHRCPHCDEPNKTHYPAKV
jgi:rubrerythrin|tara:strand:- start:3666 stop:3863 length:198 start_codon:yes stop_codon:yes gene_type:complete